MIENGSRGEKNKRCIFVALFFLNDSKQSFTTLVLLTKSVRLHADKKKGCMQTLSKFSKFISAASHVN